MVAAALADDKTGPTQSGADSDIGIEKSENTTLADADGPSAARLSDPSDAKASPRPQANALTGPTSAPGPGPPGAGRPPAAGGPIPNGGLWAWLQVLGAFMVFFNTWGILNTFGAFQTYYESGDLFVQSSANISWIGAIQAYFVLVGGLFSGPIYDRGYLRTVLVVGSFAIVFGHMMLSISHEYWQAFLAQGVCAGVGAGLIFTPALAVLPAYFSTRIGLAMGLAASGSSFGGVIYPIVFYRLMSQVGFAWSVRVLAFIALATSMFPIILLRQRVKPAKARAVMDWASFTDVSYMVFTLGSFIGFIGLDVFLFYQSYYAEATRLTDPALAFYLVPILNAGSMFGRTLPNALSDKTGPFNVLIPGTVICSILVFSMQTVHSTAAVVVVVALFGFFSGVFIALPPVIFVKLTEDKSKIGTRIGMGMAIMGAASFAGGPGAGGVLRQSSDDGHNWAGLWSYGGATLAASALIFATLRCWKYGSGLRVKA